MHATDLHRALLSRAAAAAVFLSAVLSAQTFKFENGIADWSRQGEAFARQPFCGEMLSTVFAKSKIGGDYWKDLRFPLGHQGKCLLTTIAQPAGAGVGRITSPEFTLRPEARFLSFRIGGTRDAARERIELQVRVPPGDEALRQYPERDGDYLIVATATGHDVEALRQEVIEIPRSLSNRAARIRVIDDREDGHLNLDFIQFTSQLPPALRAPVWGWADYHTHPMSCLAFGGLRGVKSLWGVPGGNVEDYRDPSRVSGDIGHCMRGHGGGPKAEPFLNTAQMLDYTLVSIIKSFLLPHKRRGGPEFDYFPAHLMGAHQQMHITGIRRSYEGGLRLMVAFATDNMAAQFLTARVKKEHIDLAPELESLDAQVAAIEELVKLNRSWMEIARSAADARRIIRENRLAVVLGAEFDQLGELKPGADDAATPQAETAYLWNKGVRAVIPIHAVNNKIGGAAILNEPYNWLNDLTHRANKDARDFEVARTPPIYFEIDPAHAPCGPDTRGHCVLGKLSPIPELRVAIGRPFWNLFRLSPVIFPAPYVKAYETSYGHKNLLGLRDFGKRYIQAMMDRGLILDTAHMSDKSVEDTFAEIGARLKRLRPECQQFGLWTDVPASCDEDAYPTMISHAHFRKQALMQDTAVKEYLPWEYDISERNLKMLARVGGVVGPFVTEPRIDKEGPHAELPIECGNSSVNFAHSYHYAANTVNADADRAAWASRVGVATDMTFIPMASPRFGPNACDGWTAYRNGTKERQLNPERHSNTNPCRVRYRGGAAVSCGQTQPEDALEPYRMDRRVFDFNTDGLASYALVPDLLQDLKNLGAKDLGAFFQSAEGFLRMWEKVERLAGK